MAKAVISALSKLPKGAVKTITCDRGSEFANCREIEQVKSVALSLKIHLTRSVMPQKLHPT